MSGFRHQGSLRIREAVAVRAGLARHPSCGETLAKIRISHWIGTACAACLGAGVLLALSGCASARVRLGWRVRLDDIPIRSVSASLPNGPGIAPGEKSPLVVVITEPNGATLQTEGKGHGKVLWQDLQVTASLASVNRKGILSLPPDPRMTEGKVAHVAVALPNSPDIHAELDVPVRYNYNFSANFSGGSGSSGMNGSDGTDGTSGSIGSMDPNNPSAGGNGSNGTDGSNGQDGATGYDAPSAQVRVALKAGSRPLLEVSVSAAGRETFYLVDPDGGSLTVKADGGDGGSGGKGGRGGHGGAGGTGTPNGSNGTDGTDGRNGWDGWQGKGGRITVTYDAQARPFLGILHFSNKNGPPPVFKEEPVGPMW